MKRALALLLAMLMLLPTAVACGNKSNQADRTETTTAPVAGDTTTTSAPDFAMIYSSSLSQMYSYISNSVQSNIASGIKAQGKV